MKEYSCEGKYLKNLDVYQKPSNHFNLRYLMLEDFNHDQNNYDILEIEAYIDSMLIKKKI